MASVKVAVRARPISQREIDMNCSSILRMDGKKTFITNTKLPQGGNDTLGRERVKQFTYDHSYWSADPDDQNHASQEQVFNDLGHGVVESALDGYNACVFAYGQTGSGKTYTMMGTPDNHGLIPRICEDLFCKMNHPDTTYRTEVSFLEIYNERVRDLLRDKKEKQQILRVREHPKHGPYVQDLSKHLVVDYSDVSELLERGNISRTTASTNMNDYSSRSHAIFTLLFTQARFNEDIPCEINSKIHLVDLAGSERAAASGATGDRLKEGGSINKSLVTLGNVISTLADLSDKMAAIRKHVFIPYRDSVLTWLLKDSLGGNSKTVMIATVSPAECNYAESLSTLRYANRAKRIVNQPTINEDPHVKLIRELREENRRLKALLGEDRGLVAMQEKLSRNEEKVKKLTEKWTDKWHETASILQEHKMLALRKEGTGVVLDSELPYLLALDPNILTTGMKLYHLKEEEIRVGTDQSPDPPDIVLSGKFIEPNHCLIVHQNGEVFLVPLEGALCSVNNVRIHEATKLTQGAVIRLGSSNIFRFNHPGEAAKMREEIFKHNGPNSQTDQLVWEDFRWSWSRSMTDSALGSELDLDQSTCSEEWGKLEARRRELERQEEEHCLAEARRLAALAEQEVSKATLQEKEEELKNLTSKAASMKLKAEKAHKDIKKLSESFEQQLASDFELKKKLQEEKDRLREQKEKLEKNKQRAREERKKIRKEREVEKAKQDLEKERQQEEWERMKLEKEQADTEKQKNELKLKSEKEHLQEEREIEQAIYHESMTDMRLLVEREVKDMRRLVGVPDRETGEEDLHELQLSDLLDGPVIPAEFLQKSLEPPMSSPTLPFTEATADNINDRLEELGAQVLEIRSKVYSVLHRKYNSILSIDDVTPGLCEEVVCQFNALRPLFSQLEKVAKSCNSDKSIEEKLKHYDAILATVDTFLQIHAVVQDIDNAIKVKEFLIAIERMDAVHNLLTSLELEESAEQDLHRLLNTEVSILREKLLFELSETWNKLLKWTLPLDLKRVTNKPSKVTLEVSGVEKNKEVFTKTVQAMFDTNLLESRLKTLFDRIMTYFVQAVIRDRNTLLQIIDETEKYICVIFQPMKGHQGAVPVPPMEAFSKLEQVFLFLHKPFDKVVVNETDGAGAGAKSKAVTLVEKMGSMISKPLFECVYNECLCHFIPRSSKQFESFTEIIKLTETFQSTLVELNFAEQQESTMMDYLSDVNSMFVNIKSQELLKKAEEFMTKELMFSIQISKEHPLGFRSKRRESEEQEKFVNNCRDLAGTSQYRFPTCQVSVPVRSLMCLAYDTCKEAINGSTANALHLCQSVCRMFELYCDLVPSYHKEKLMNLPLLAALHHNNCMFVAHHIITLDQMFQSKLPSPRDSRLGDLVPNVRRLGNDSFSDHVAMKKYQLCAHLSDADGFECVADDYGEGASKAVRLMLHHLRHIGSVWRDVLPTNVYFKAMENTPLVIHGVVFVISAIMYQGEIMHRCILGSLLNAAVVEMTDCVLAIEEFSAEDCEYLQRVLSIVIDNAGRVFEGADSTQNSQVILHEYVDTWMKFTELNLVLKSGLQQVSDRWADGKGPLALHFSAEEIRALVIAMFENTSKRDALLKQLR